MLTAENLAKDFHQGSKTLSILKNVSFELKKGSSMSILGQSGSGKSTLLSILAGLESPSHGSVTIDETNLTALNEKEISLFRARNIGIIFQQFHLMANLTALENVSLPAELLGKSQSSEIAQDLLAKVGLADRADHFPAQLSGGELQRVAIARALINRPAVVFADEPSGSLDQATGSLVMDLLFRLAEEESLTLVLVTHDTKLAERCETVSRLDAGCLQSC